MPGDVIHSISLMRLTSFDKDIASHHTISDGSVVGSPSYFLGSSMGRQKIAKFACQSALVRKMHPLCVCLVPIYTFFVSCQGEAACLATSREAGITVRLFTRGQSRSKDAVPSTYFIGFSICLVALGCLHGLTRKSPPSILWYQKRSCTLLPLCGELDNTRLTLLAICPTDRLNNEQDDVAFRGRQLATVTVELRCALPESKSRPRLTGHDISA